MLSVRRDTSLAVANGGPLPRRVGTGCPSDDPVAIGRRAARNANQVVGEISVLHYLRAGVQLRVLALPVFLHVQRIGRPVFPSEWLGGMIAEVLASEIARPLVDKI